MCALSEVSCVFLSTQLLCFSDMISSKWDGEYFCLAFRLVIKPSNIYLLPALLV